MIGANRQWGAGLNAFLLIGLGGVLGANARYLVSTWAAGRYGVDFPYGTFIVNVSGSVLLGFVLALIADLSGAAEARYLLATGFLGAYTTFSTFTYETVGLIRAGGIRRALINVLGSAAAGVRRVRRWHLGRRRHQRVAAVKQAPRSLPDSPRSTGEEESAGDRRTDPAERAGIDWRQRAATPLAIGAGGFLGANARYLVGLWALERWGTAFPWGTLIVNVAGSFVLGVYLALVTERFAGRPATRLFVATGFLGAFTTFSTFSYEAVSLVSAGAPGAALAYVAGSLVIGLVAAAGGVLCAHAL